MRTTFIFFLLTISTVALGQQPDTTAKVIECTNGQDAGKIYEPYNCDQKALFPGGDNELIRYVCNNTKYPVFNMDPNIEGTVYIKFVVTKSGEISKVEVIRSVHPLFNEEAIRVVKTFPQWSPAIKGSIPVNSWFIVPVKFKLQ